MPFAQKQNGARHAQPGADHHAVNPARLEIVNLANDFGIDSSSFQNQNGICEDQRGGLCHSRGNGIA